MRAALFFFFIFTASANASHFSNANNNDEKFDSAHSVLIEAVIPEGRITSNNSNDQLIKYQIEEQLLYTIGQLNGLDGGAPDTNRTQLEIKEIKKNATGLFDVLYSAKLLVAWPREKALPNTFKFILPAATFSMSSFFQKYGSDEEGEKKCLDWEAHEVSSSIFWYHYRPDKKDCSLNEDSNPDSVKLTAYLQLSEENTSDKYPEYNKIWEDGKLIITAIFGKAVAGATEEYDEGVSSYVVTVNELIKRFGVPATTSVPLDERNRFSEGIKNPEIYLTFKTDKGIVDAALFMIDGIRVVPSAFAQKYNKRTLVSDFISYSGHSGLGANIRALARMGKFSPNQYQIFLINGCDTFAYVDNSLQKEHFKLNPEASPDKYIDIITNAMPSYFHMNPYSNMAVISSLYDTQLTYREILSLFAPYQRAVVTGEQDNSDPIR